MTDVALVLNPTILEYDLAMNAGGTDLLLDEGLDTAVTISLFTDRLADAGDSLPFAPADEDRRGTWMDAFPLDPAIPPNSDPMGSRLWLLYRSILTVTQVIQAEDYVMESCGWMITDGVAGTIGAVGTINGISELDLDVTIGQQGSSAVYSRQWTKSA